MNMLIKQDCANCVAVLLMDVECAIVIIVALNAQLDIH